MATVLKLRLECPECKKVLVDTSVTNPITKRVFGRLLLPEEEVDIIFALCANLCVCHLPPKNASGPVGETVIISAEPTKKPKRRAKATTMRAARTPKKA